MFNLIRSIGYNIMRSKVFILTMLSLVGMPFLFLILNDENATMIKKISGVDYFGGYMGDMYIISIIGMIILSAVICGGDAGDKTINYEFMDGHSRKSIFASRILCNFFWSGIVVTGLVCLPFALVTLLNGVGKGAVLSDLVLRSILTLLPTFRLVMLFSMLTMVARSAAKGGALSYMCFMITVIATEGFQVSGIEYDFLNYAVGFQNCVILFSHNNATPMVIDGEQLIVSDYSLSAGVVGTTCLVSLVMGVLYLGIAYVVFVRSDRD